MDRKFSLAYLTLPGIDPISQIRIAAEAGYDCVSLRTIPMGLAGEPQIHPEEDPQLQKKCKTPRGRDAQKSHVGRRRTQAAGYRDDQRCGTWGGNIVSENITLKHYMNTT